jgi:RNA polymerase sigma-70 factor (ECF subfamily)
MSVTIHVNPIVAFQEGDEEGFNHFFNEYYNALYFFACKFLKDEDKVEDVVLESFMKVWERKEKFETEVKAKAYLYRCVYTGCMREVRSQKLEARKKNGLVIVSDEFEKDYSQNLIHAEALRLVYESLNELPEQCRAVFTKLYVEGKTVAEIADEMGVAVSTVKNQKSRGVKLIRGKLKIES